MRISTKVVIDMESGVVLQRDSYEYAGEMALLKSNEQKQQQRTNLSAADQHLAMQKQAALQSQWDVRSRDAALNPLQAYAQQLMGLGTDAMSGKSPFSDLFRAQARNSVGDAFGGARGNLQEGLAAQGLYGSGMSGGQMANFETQQAKAFSEADIEAWLQSISQSFSLGNQGAGMMGQVAGSYSPTQFAGLSTNAGQAAFADPKMYSRAGGGLLGSILGAGASAGLGLATGGASAMSLAMPKGRLPKIPNFWGESQVPAPQYNNLGNFDQFNPWNFNSSGGQ